MKRILVVLVLLLLGGVGVALAEDGSYLMTEDNILHYTTADIDTLSAVSTTGFAISTWEGSYITLGGTSWRSCDETTLKILIKLITGITVSSEAANALCETKLEKLPLLTRMKPTARSLEEWRIQEDIKALSKELSAKQKELDNLGPANEREKE